MSSELASTVPLEVMIIDLEAAIEAAPLLDVQIADGLRGHTSATQFARSVKVNRESTRNLEQSRGRDSTRVEDIVVVELAFRIRPKDQRASRNEAYDLARQLRNRVTQYAHPTLHPYDTRHMTTAERVNGEWLEITQRYRFHRNESVGQGI